jgi:hypothetical protein
VPTRLAPLALAVLVAAVSFSACASDREQVAPAPDAFCEAVIDLEDGLAELAGKPEDVQIREQIPLVRRVAETAPRQVEGDARTFLEALEALSDNPDDQSLRDDPEVQEAVDNVERYAIDGCELYERDGGGSPF